MIDRKLNDLACSVQYHALAAQNLLDVVDLLIAETTLTDPEELSRFITLIILARDCTKKARDVGEEIEVLSMKAGQSRDNVSITPG